MHHVRPRHHLPGIAEEFEVGSSGPDDVGPKLSTEPSQRESTLRVFPKNPVHAQRTKNPVEARSVNAELRAELLRGPWPGGKPVGHAKLRGYIECLGRPRADSHPKNRQLSRNQQVPELGQ